MNRNRFRIAAALTALVIASSAVAATSAKETGSPAAKAKATTTSTKTVQAKKTDSKAKSETAKPAPKRLPRLVDLGSTTCIPCKMMTPVLDELSKEYKDKLRVEFIDVKKDSGAVERYKIQAIPTQIFYNAQGKELYRHQGYFPKEDIVKKFAELGIKLAK